MADKTAEDDLDLKPADAGAMFRVEMFLTNTLLGYWKHLVGAVVLILLSILAWGQYRDMHQSGQRNVTAQIAQSLAELPASLQELPQLQMSGQPLDLAKVEATGDDLVAIANPAGGTAKAEALLYAAELFRIAGKVDKQRAALTSAVAVAPDTLAYAAEAGLANLELAQNEGDAAVARLKKLSESQKGFMGEQAALDLGLALEQLGRKDEASKVYADFLTKYKDSASKELVEERQARLAAAPTEGATPAEGAAPAPAEGAAPLPTDGAAPAGGAAPAEGAPPEAPAAPAPGGAG